MLNIATLTPCFFKVSQTVLLPAAIPPVIPINNPRTTGSVNDDIMLIIVWRGVALSLFLFGSLGSLGKFSEKKLEKGISVFFCHKAHKKNIFVFEYILTVSMFTSLAVLGLCATQTSALGLAQGYSIVIYFFLFISFSF